MIPKLEMNDIIVGEFNEFLIPAAYDNSAVCCGCERGEPCQNEGGCPADEGAEYCLTHPKLFPLLHILEVACKI
jgi:hypothetical protein